MIKSATVILDDDRFDDVVVTWIVGTNNLQLCHKGEYVLGADGEGMKWQPAAMIRAFTIKTGITHENVEDEARKVFDSMGEIFENSYVEAGDDEWRD